MEGQDSLVPQVLGPVDGRLADHLLAVIVGGHSNSVGVGDGNRRWREGATCRFDASLDAIEAEPQAEQEADHVKRMDAHGIEAMG